MKRSIRSEVFIWFYSSIVIFLVANAVLVFFVAQSVITEFVLKDHQRLFSQIDRSILNNFSIHLRSIESFFSAQPVSMNRSRLKDFLAIYPTFSSLHLYDLKGRLLRFAHQGSVKPYRPETKLQDIKQKEVLTAYLRAVELKKPQLSEIVKTSHGFWYFVYFIPYYKQGVVVSASVALNLTDLDYLVEAWGMNADHFVQLMDRNQGVIAQTKHQPEGMSSSVSLLMTGGQLLNPEAIHAIEDSSHHRYHVLIKKMSSLPLILVLGVNDQLIQNKLQVVYKSLFIIFTFSLLLSYMFALRMGRRISKPFEKVLQALKQLLLGNFSHRLDEKENSELGLMAKMTNELSIKLEKNQMLGEFWSSVEDLDSIKNTNWQQGD